MVARPLRLRIWDTSNANSAGKQTRRIAAISGECTLPTRLSLAPGWPAFGRRRQLGREISAKEHLVTSESPSTAKTRVAKQKATDSGSRFRADNWEKRPYHRSFIRDGSGFFWARPSGMWG